MGLRQYLEALRAGNEGFNAAGNVAVQGAEAQKQQMVASQLRELGPKLPEFLARGEPGLQEAFGEYGKITGDIEPALTYGAKSLRDKAAASAKAAGKGSLLTKEQIAVFPNLRPEQVDVVAAQTTRDDQNDLLKTLNPAITSFNNLGARKEGMKDTDERSDRSILDSQVKNFKAQFEPEIKKYEDDVKLINDAQKALDLGTTVADNVATNIVLRSIGGEKGPLSDADRAAVLSRVFGNDEQKAANFFAGGAKSILQPEQKQALMDILKTSMVSKEELGAQRFTRLLNDSLVDHFEMNKDGKPSKQLMARANQVGAKYDPIKGEFTMKVEKKHIEPDWVGSVPAEYKSQVQQKIKAAGNDQAKIKRIEDHLRTKGILQ